jgi:hypothetical protein
MALLTVETVMKHCIAGLCTVLTLATSAYAQPQIGSYTPPVVNPRPLISPYLNLNARGMTNSAVNYYGIVRPQMENHQAIQQLQQQFQMTQNLQPGQTGQMQPDEMMPTGHSMGGYFNYSHYFPIYSRSAGGTGGTAGTGLTGIRR